MSDAAPSPATASPAAPAPTPATDAAPSPGAGPKAVAPAAKGPTKAGRSTGADAPSSQGDRLAKERAEEKAAKAAAETPPEAPKPLEKRKYKQKVDGKEYEEELSDEEVTIRLQKAAAAERRFQEAAQERARIAKIMELGKNDPTSAYKQLFGVENPEAYWEEKLAAKYKQELEMAKMKPEERVAKEYESKLAAMKAEADAFRKQIEEKEQAALDEQVHKEVTSSFETALQEEGMPKSWEMLAEMAKVAKMANNNGLNLSPRQLAMEVRNRVEARQDQLRSQYMTSLKGEDLVKHLGDDVAKEVIRTYLARQKTATVPPPAAPVKAPPKPKPVEKESLSPQRFMKKLALGID